jgi:RHS repeat-associated protein
MLYGYNAVDLTEVKRINLSGEQLYSQTYRYDQAGNLIQKDLPFNIGQTTYTYDLLHRHKSIQSPHFSETGVTYDAVGNLLTQTYTDPIGRLPCQYAYDDLYQLNSEKSSANHSYQHDSLFNRFVKDDQRFDFNSLNQLLGDKLSAYAYDPNGNLSERHDQKYTYDAWDRLLSVTIGNIRFNYTYDDLSRRLSKVKSLWDPLTDNWVTQDTQYFLYQGDNEVGVCDAEQHLMEFRPLGHGRGAEIGAAVAFEIQGQVYIPLTNFTGHVQVLLNSKGEPVDIYRYTAFGEETIFDPSGDFKKPITSWRFCSKRTDPETGLIYFGRRYYDPQIARWITADPLGYEARPNLYAYVNNSPLTSIDLFGLSEWSEFEKEQTLQEMQDRETGYQASKNFIKGVYNRLTKDYSNAPPEILNGECYDSYSAGKLGEYTVDGIFLAADAALLYSGAGLAYNLGSFALKKGTQRVMLQGMQKILKAEILETASQGFRKAATAEANVLLAKAAAITSPTATNTITATKHLFQKTILSKKSTVRTLDAISELGLKNGMRLPTNKVLEMAEKFLGIGYKEAIAGSGRFVSADGKRVFRMGLNNLLGKHSGGPHVNFELLVPNLKTGKVKVGRKAHIYLTD